MRTLSTMHEPTAGGDPGDRRYQRQLLLVIMLSVMAFGSLMTIVTVSLDQIAQDLGSTRATITWTISGLMVAVAVTTPIGGKLGDIYGNRRMLLIGLAGGSLATFLCAWAPNAILLIVFRVLFGIFGGLVNPNAMSLMIRAYGIERRATALGWFNFAMTGSPVIGVVVSGPLIDRAGWRPVFVGFACVSALALIVAAVIARPTPRLEGTPIDVQGAATLAAGVLAGLLTITRFLETMRDEGIGGAVSNPWVLLLAATSALSIRLFIGAERRSPAPLLKLEYFGRRNFTMPMIAAALTQFAYMGGFVVTPKLLGDGYGWTIGSAALLIASRPAAFSGASLLGGKLPSLIGLRKPVIIGTCFMIASMVAFTAASTLTSLVGIILITGGLALSGIAAGVSQPSVAATMVGAVDPVDMGIANGMNQQVTMIGIVCGIQTMSVLVGDDPSSTRFALTFGFGGLIAVGGLLAAVSMPDTDRRLAA